MLEESATQLFRIEVSALDCLWLQKDLQQSRRRRLAKPVNERHGEALFSTIEHLLGDTEPLGQPFEDVLGLARPHLPLRSEEHTSELQSRLHLVCRLLLEKKKHLLRNVIYRIEHLRAY